MSCSRLVGSIVLSFFLITSLVANNIVSKSVKLGQETEQSAEEGSFSNTGDDSLLGTGTYKEGYNTAEEYQKVKDTDGIIRAGDPNHPKSVGPFKKGSLNENPLTFTNGAKNASDIIKAKNASDVIKSSTRSDASNSIDSGAIGVLVKEGEVLRKEGSIVRSNSSDIPLNFNDNSHSPFKINTRTESVIEGQGVKFKEIEIPINTEYQKNSAFKMNTRPESIIKRDGRPDCPEGTVADCSGDGDCISESWIGDGWCDGEDQAFGADLSCYDNDGGDCADNSTTTSGGGANLIWSAPITFDWGCSGYYGSGTVNFYDDGSADASGAPGYWYQNTQTFDMPAGLCAAQTLTPTVIFNFSGYTTSFAWETSGNGYPSDPGCGIHDDYGYNGPNVDGTTSINMTDPSMCYEDSTTTTTTSGGGGCPAGTVDDCSGDGDCCPESWIGDGFEDCEDQAFGCDLTCYDNDGGDCGGGTTTTTTTGGTDALASYTITFDWYCTGSPGSSTLDIFEDGTALLAGAYTGTWMSDMGDMPLGDGLCPGSAFTNDLSFMFDNYATVYMWDMEDGLCSNGSGYHDDTAYNGEGNVDGLTDLGFVAGNCEDEDPCDGQAGGDANGDGAVNVLDVVSIVNYILAGGDGLDDCGAAVSDYNGDGAVNVLDVVAIVNMILAGGGRTVDATNATMIQTVNGVDISADGYIGGVQMTLSHGTDFSIELTDNAYVAEYKTNGNSTMLIVINPENEEIFRSSGDFTIDEVLVTNSQEFIDVAKELPVSFTLSNAYPNPFNPTTTLTLDIADQSFASVKVFNLRGEVVGVLMNDMVNAGSYTMTWDASNLSSGVYMIKAEANGQIASQKVMLVK